MPSKPILLAGQMFPTLGAAQKRIHEILANYRPGMTVNLTANLLIIPQSETLP